MQQALISPVASDDNEVVAVLWPDATLHVLSSATGNILARLSLPKAIKQAIGDINTTRWSPESFVFEQDQVEITRRWILLSFNTRVVVLTVDAPSRKMSSQNQATVLVDYQLETHLGKITFADFVISHEHVLVIFETALHASMLSTTSPNRSDIPLPKHPDHRGICQSPVRNSFAMVTKSKGQDNIAIFSSSDGVLGHPLVFAAGTSDIQGLKWAPNGDPIIAAWDTGAHGIKVVFFTALGHPLRKLELSHNTFFPDQALSGIGVSRLSWCKSAVHDTVLAIGDGHGNVFVRAQNNRDMTTTLLSHFKHTSTADGSTYIIWQETDDQKFIQQEIALDLHFNPDTPIEDIAFNSSTTFLSTKITAFPKAIWIWQIGKPIPVTVLLFRHDVRQINWHPSVPHVLLITTAQSKVSSNSGSGSGFFCWHDVQLPPQIIYPHHSGASGTGFNTNDPPQSSTTSRMRVQWLQQHSYPNTRVPILVSTPKNFNIGLLRRAQDHVSFESIMTTNYHGLSGGDEFDESVTTLDTPSKSAPQANSSARMLDDISENTKRILPPTTDDEW